MAYQPWLCHVTGSTIPTFTKDGTGDFGEVSLLVGAGRDAELGVGPGDFVFAALSSATGFFRGNV